MFFRCLWKQFQEKVALGTLVTKYVPFAQITKPLSRNAFGNLCCKLGIWDFPIPYLRGSKGTDLSIKGEEYEDINQNHKLILGDARIKGLPAFVT